MDILESNKATKCTPSEELVALLYDELDRASRTVMENHLAACDACAGEFAELSFARLDVYEWHRDEFVEMATPRIVIPYEEVIVGTSWFDALAGVFAWPGRWATAGAAFAAVAIAALGFWAISSQPEERAAVNDDVKIVQSNERPTAAPTPAAVESVPEGERRITPQKTPSASPKKQPGASVKANRLTPGPTKERPATGQPANARRQAAPRLNDFDDEDDTTLRLGDLLAEIDTRK